MTDEDEETGGLVAMLRARSGAIIGVIGLLAWCALLWGMFGDVL